MIYLSVLTYAYTHACVYNVCAHMYLYMYNVHIYRHEKKELLFLNKGDSSGWQHQHLEFLKALAADDSNRVDKHFEKLFNDIQGFNDAEENK